MLGHAMAARLPHQVDPADEQRHAPDAGALWNESHYLDFVDDQGSLAGYARIGLYPNLGVTWWTAMVVGPDRPVVASVSYDLPVAAGTGLDLDAVGHRVSGVVEAPLEAMTLRGTVPGVEHADAAEIYLGEGGRPTEVGFDLTWRTDGVPYHYEVTTRYEIPCLVEGEVTVGSDRFEVRGSGQRDHSWGERDWWAFGWCWAAVRLDDGTRLHLADIRIPGQAVAFGYVQPPGGPVEVVEAAAVTEVLGEHGMPVEASTVLEPQGIDVAIRPFAFGPLVLTATDGRVSRFPRAAARFTTGDGRSGNGWIEWNQPPRAASAE